MLYKFQYVLSLNIQLLSNNKHLVIWLFIVKYQNGVPSTVFVTFNNIITL